MLRKALLVGLLAASPICATLTVHATDDATPRTEAVDPAYFRRGLAELGNGALELHDRIDGLGEEIADPFGGAASKAPLALDGYCPVELVEHRRWVLGSARHLLVHRGRTYLFVDAEAKATFLAFPERYRPVYDGSDPVAWLDQGVDVPGQREHGVFYRGRIYLFEDEENLQAFARAAELYVARIPEDDSIVALVRRKNPRK